MGAFYLAGREDLVRTLRFDKIARQSPTRTELRGGRTSIVVMKATGQDQKLGIGRLIDQPMALIDSP
ncbi:MAG: hypothetical protein A2286_02140 [Gammaproteobacteria bacterium RIFOXYA12_FULL_61_12]|nr:MAG: hypothetical protein A2514_15815 [Gammaproteobacteria bacterium RIFOXYD12_FULL_61_37]OGT92223.1 MAG: hypothetical protein A2286_02140 [Gammaproteobacteria bacterium RIFOXYA12_FULL_61_12]